MRNRLIGSIAIAALALAACGGDDSGGQQDEVADMMLTVMSEESGLSLDEACVREAAQGITDEDADKIVEAGMDGDPAISEESDQAIRSMASCVSLDDMVDEIAEQFGDSVDRDCLRDALDGVDLAALDEADFGPELLECVNIGG
jgi:hypothetical protein